MVLPKMVQKYRQLMRMEEQNPEAYQVMLTQAKFEDEALGYARDKDDAKLRDVAHRMIQKGLEDRRERIEKLEKILDDQKQKLSEDEQNADQLVAQQVDR